MRRFSKTTIDRLGAYVYMLVDPRDNRPLYMGKGQGNRIFEHIENIYRDPYSAKSMALTELVSAGIDVRHLIVRHGLSNEEALHVEAALIDALGLENLTNVQSGHHKYQQGMISVIDIWAEYEMTEAIIDVRAVVFKIPRLYKPGMTREEIYKAGRGIWRIAWQKHNPDYAIISAHGTVLGVYSISRWNPADFERLGTQPDGRWMFDGVWAEELEHLVGTSLENVPKSKSQKEFFYVKC